MGDYADDGSGHSNDLSNYHVPGLPPPANRTWGYNAGKEYRIHTDELESLAKALAHDLEDLQKALRSLASMLPITTQHVGMSRGGTNFAALAQRAQQGFNQCYEDLQTGYQAVIFKLYRSAGNYREAEKYSTSAVLSADTGSTSSSPTPTTTDSTQRWS